jgi:UDP-glucose 4-epimerase
MQTLLLTWWTWYIGSHAAVVFLQAGYNVIILDNLSNSSEEVLGKIKNITGKEAKFYQWDIKNTADIEKIFQENTIDGVVHFAGLKAVGESCEKPFQYYENNVIGSKNLFEIMEKYSCRKIIFSSSATVYDTTHPNAPDLISPLSLKGEGARGWGLKETSPTGNTTNPYGTTKFLIENILRDLATHTELHVANLRYFNPIGAHESWLIGEDPNDIPNNLLPYIMKVASWELRKLSVFWNDYDTPDWTGVRDYIHVMDLAQAHLKAWEYLHPPIITREEMKGCFESFNLGTGKWSSVLEMVHATEAIIWKPLPYTISARRPGDIASAYCSPEKARELLNWKAEKSVKEAIADSWNFIQNQKK